MLQLKLPNIAEKENISIKEGNKIVDLNKLRINDLRKKARMRNIKIVKLFSKEELIYILLEPDKPLYEDKYISKKIIIIKTKLVILLITLNLINYHVISVKKNDNNLEKN